MRSHALPLLHWEPAVVAGMVIDASSYLRAHSRSPSPDPTLAVHADRGPSTCLQEELADSVSLPPGVCPTAPRATSQLNLSVVLSFEPLPCDGISLVSLSHSTRRDAAHACSQPHHPAAAPSLGPRPLPHSGLLPPRPPAGSRDPTARPCRSSSRVRAPPAAPHRANPSPRHSSSARAARLAVAAVGDHGAGSPQWGGLRDIGWVPTPVTSCLCWSPRQRRRQLGRLSFLPTAPLLATLAPSSL